VLSSWFGEHPAAIQIFYHLDFERFTFREVAFAPETLPGEETFRDGARSIDTLVQESDVTHRGLKVYLEQHANWPVPPILLDTGSSTLPPHVPFSLKRPYHLLDGYHRIALAHRLIGSGLITTPLTFWMARIL
jgi:hypothetical protein